MGPTDEQMAVLGRALNELASEFSWYDMTPDDAAALYQEQKIGDSPRARSIRQVSSKNGQVVLYVLMVGVGGLLLVLPTSAEYVVAARTVATELLAAAAGLPQAFGSSMEEQNEATLRRAILSDLYSFLNSPDLPPSMRPDGAVWVPTQDRLELTREGELGVSELPRGNGLPAHVTEVSARFRFPGSLDEMSDGRAPNDLVATFTRSGKRTNDWTPAASSILSFFFR